MREEEWSNNMIILRHLVKMEVGSSGRPTARLFEALKALTGSRLRALVSYSSSSVEPALESRDRFSAAFHSVPIPPARPPLGELSRSV